MFDENSMIYTENSSISFREKNKGYYEREEIIMDRKQFKHYMNALTELRCWVQAGLDLCKADKEERDAALDADEEIYQLLVKLYEEGSK